MAEARGGRSRLRLLLIGLAIAAVVVVSSLYFGYAALGDKYLGACLETGVLAEEARAAGRSEEAYCACMAQETANRVTFGDQVFGMDDSEQAEIANAAARACGLGRDFSS